MGSILWRIVSRPNIRRCRGPHPAPAPLRASLPKWLLGSLRCYSALSHSGRSPSLRWPDAGRVGTTRPPFATIREIGTAPSKAAPSLL
ncbi:MAG: hypothetical protein ACK51L_04750 [bacterium]